MRGQPSGPAAVLHRRTIPSTDKCRIQKYNPGYVPNRHNKRVVTTHASTLSTHSRATQTPTDTNTTVQIIAVFYFQTLVCLHRLLSVKLEKLYKTTASVIASSPDVKILFCSSEIEKKPYKNSREHIKRIYIFFSFFKQTLQQIKYINIKSIRYRHNIRDNLYCLSALVDFSWSILLLMDQNRNRWLCQSIIRGNDPIKYSIPMHKIQRVDTVNIIMFCFTLAQTTMTLLIVGIR